MAKILVVRDEEFERMQHYAQESYGNGGWQNLFRKLITRQVAFAEQVELAVKQTEKAEKGLFG